MVQFKRKPVQFLSVPRDVSKDTEIWVMRHTGEVFQSYESYLKRYDYYKQKKFTCDITGHSGLTFFDALESETAGSRELESTFPDALREPVLRKVQFSTVGRLDDLVTQLHDVFKEDFFPGETVSIIIQETGERTAGVIRDKASFSRHVKPDGTLVREAMSRYFVNTSEATSRMILVDNKHMFRDRKMFSKQVLKSFLKNSTRRDAWAGAPWLVKDELAIMYNIKRTVPPSLQQEAVAAEKKALAALKKEAQGHKTKGSLQQASRQLKGNHLQNPQALHGLSPTFATRPDAQSHSQFFFTSRPRNHQSTALQPIAFKSEASPPVTVKYPIDDLEIHPTGDGVSRPQLKYFSNTTPLDLVYRTDGLHMSSVGPLLEIWNTLNVHCEVFELDSFTFDDFADAMEFSSEDIDCELFVEIHCAVLKMLVDEDGNVNVTLPEIPDDDSEEEPSAESSPASTPGPENTGRRTRNVNRNIQAFTNGVKKPEEPSEPTQTHMAAEMLADNSWIDRLQKRDFRDGGWQVIMIGMLHQLSLKPSQEEACDKILAHLAPVDLQPTQETARKQYLSLDVNSRIAALEMATILAVQTKTLREYMEECSDQMTVYRKQKIEWQRERKAHIEDLKALDEQRKLLMPEEPEADTDIQEIPNDVSEEHLEEDGNTLISSDSDDEAPHRGHSLRRGNDRANERKRKRDEDIARKEKEKKLKACASKEPAQLRKVRKDIEKKKQQIKDCEDHIATLDGDLRENSCQRTKVLGRDRFWNRYYWFERNGMPFAGIPSSSTSHYGYANGRLWVQGPDELEREGFINLEEPEMSRYRLAFGVSVPERKIQEEGETNLNTARQWGFYDDPEDLDTLIGWLDDRGKREKALRKELTIWRDKISEYMGKLNKHLAENAATKAGSEDPVIGVATRKKTYVDNTVTRHPCLNWRNTYALEHNGHLHSEQPKPRKKYARGTASQRVTGPSEKLSTRSGTRYTRN